MFFKQSRQTVSAALVGAFVVTMSPVVDAFDYNRVSKHVVAVTMYSDADIGEGSGVILGDEYVLTNCHIVESNLADAVAIEIRAKVGSEIKSFDGALDERVGRHDLCFVQVPGLISPWPPTPVGSVKEVATGSEVCAIGHSLAPTDRAGQWASWGWSMSCGVFSQLRTCSELKNQIPEVSCGTVSDPIIRMDTLIPHGSSGGGLFDGSSGALLGITTYPVLAGSVFAVPGYRITATTKYSRILARTARSARKSGEVGGVIKRIRHYRIRNRAFVELAARQVKEGDPAPALESLEASLRVRDTTDLVRYTRLMVETAKLQLMAGDKKKAKATLARVSSQHAAGRRSDWALAPSMLYLARGQSELGEIKKAKATLSRAWRLARGMYPRSPHRRAGLLAAISCHQIEVGDKLGAAQTRHAFEKALPTINRGHRTDGIESLRRRVERCWRLPGPQADQDVSR